MIITLKDTEVEIVKHIGALKSKRCRIANAKNTPYRREQEELDIDAFGAEVAFCKLFNYFPDLTSNVRIKGHDVTLNNNLKVDIKQTDLPQGRLIARRTKTIEDADIYCLMRGVMPTYKFAGWCYAETILKEKNLQDLGGYGAPVYVCPDETLIKTPTFEKTAEPHKNNSLINKKRIDQMADKNYINMCWFREKKFDNGGSVINCGFNIEELKKHADENGWVNMTIAERKKVSDKGYTHYAYEDEFKPKTQQPDAAEDDKMPWDK